MTQPNHSERPHAEFSPSGLKYLASCAGFQSKDETNAAAEKGTRIHEALEVRDPSALHDEEEMDIYEKIVAMEAEFRSSVERHRTIKKEQAEILLDIKLNDGLATYGTCDLCITYADDTALLGDYKTGVSIIDAPEDNYQAKAYALGLFQTNPKLKEVMFAFFVPQHDATLSYTFLKEDVPALREELTAVVKEATRVRPKWSNGTTPALEDLKPTQHCRFCRHEDRCPALGGLVVAVARKVYPEIPDVDYENSEDPAVVEALWDIAKILEKWVERHKTRTVSLAKEGMVFPSIQLRSLGATTKCTDNDKMIELAEQFGVSEEAVMSLASIPLGGVSKLVSGNAPHGKKSEYSNNFLASLEEEGILEKSETRYTMAAR